MIVNPLAHPMCLAWPERRTAVRWWHEHIPFAMFVVDLLRPRSLVELGVQAGDSYCAFCQAVAELGLDTRAFGVDTWAGDAHAGFYGGTVLDDLRAHHDPRYGRFSTLIQSTFDTARPRFVDGSVDLLHIDGYHTYEAVKHDFESWRPALSPGGVVLLHDTNVRDRDFGTARFWDEVKRRYRSFEFLHGSGLGVLAIGDVGSPELAALLDASSGEAEAIRSLFVQLGRRLSLTDEVEALRRDLDAVEQALVIGPGHAPSPAQSRHERRHAPNLLQVFWNDAGGFSEASSVTTPLLVDDDVHDYVLPLPPDARGPWRLDLGNRPGYVEIHHIEVVASRDAGTPGGEVLERWAAAEHAPAVMRTSGVIRLDGVDTYRFVCTTDDPHLVLDGLGERRDARPWFFRVTMSTSPRMLGVMAEAIRELEEERTHLRRALSPP